MPIGEAFLSASLQGLFDKLAAPAITERDVFHGLKDELAKLQRTLRRLRAILHDAEQKKMTGESFQLWLQELKGAACDAEDLVEEFEYEDLRHKLQIESEDVRRASCCLVFSFIEREVCEFLSLHTPPEISFRSGMASKIDMIWKRLEEISRDKRDLDISGLLDVGMNQPEFKRQVETSSILTDEVFGRDAVKSKLIKLLIRTAGDASSSSSSSSSLCATSLSVLSIVGMGGLGKTTLAQLVYQSKEVKEYFNLRMWVFVSQDFDVKRLTKHVLEHVVDPHSGKQSVDSLNVLQENLLKGLKGQRFLLVLDDVWLEDYSKWRDFSAPLSYAEKGSKVLITTRNASVANMMRSVNIELESLSFDYSWLIFRRHAFPDGNCEEHPHLESIGKEIVDKLGGVPLAVATIAGVLRSELEETKWRSILENELWESEHGGKDTFHILRLSYEYLPLHLKQCFAYCCVFPKGTEFSVLRLVQMWMAQGYIPLQGKKSAEDIGRDCFNDLFNRSLIQLVNDDYVIHDLLHDLGRLILQYDYHGITEKDLEIPKDAHFKRHLMISYSEPITRQLDMFYKFTRLRTLSLWPSEYIYIHIPMRLFCALKCLRVLDLSSSNTEVLPDSIGYLKHLRYFDLRKNPIKSLPESLCSLYMLQTLKLKGCDKLKGLPEGMNNLTNLRYLEVEHGLLSKIVKIWKLIHLQNLDIFSVSNENDNKIGDLKDMNELHGKLCIQNLHMVGTREEAVEATLNKKQHLRMLEMAWADYRDIDQIDQQLEESIIEVLRPPPHLKELTVKCFAGIKFPNWMIDGSVSSLESIHLYKCRNLNPLPPFQQINCLRTLNISSCLQLKKLPGLPAKLTELILQDVKLNFLSNSLHHLPLRRLVICRIVDLLNLPLLPTTLKELTVKGVQLTVLPKFVTSRISEKDEDSDSRKPSLSILKIHDCPHLTTLHGGLLQWHHRHLQVLSIKNCGELVDWPAGNRFQATVCSLQKELSIKNCPKLKAFPVEGKLTASLEKLLVKACPGVPSKSLFGQLHNLRSHDVYVEKLYRDVASCSDEALHHIIAVDTLDIEYIGGGDWLAETSNDERAESAIPASVSLIYDREEVWSRTLDVNYLCRRVNLVIRERRGRRSVIEVDVGATIDDDDDSSNVLSLCLQDHPWTSSLRILVLDGILNNREFLHHSVCLPLLERLVIRRCREMKSLPMGVLLYHTRALNVMQISNCPELTLSSLEEGIRAVPSLKVLHIYKCPKLLMPPSTPLDSSGGIEDDASTSAASPPPPPLHPPPALPLLQYLIIDDASLLRCLLVNDSHGNQNASNNGDKGRLSQDYLLTSLQVLCIRRSTLTCLMAEEVEGLRTLASSLQYLAFAYCPHLQNLPEDLRGLLPKLKVLFILDCPGIQCLPAKGLPASLEFLFIEGCPTLAERCRPQPHATPLRIQGEEDDDWHKVALVPLVCIDDIILRGSYSRILELKAKWDFVF